MDTEVVIKPLEPTTDMISAGVSVLIDYGVSCEDPLRQVALEMFQAMAKAAPKEFQDD